MTCVYRGCLGGVLVILAGPSPVRAGDASQFDKEKVLAEWASLAKQVKSQRYEVVTVYSEAPKDKSYSSTGKNMEKYACSQGGLIVEIAATRYDQDGKTKRIPRTLRIRNRQYQATLNIPKLRESWVLSDLKPTSDPDIDYCSNLVFPWFHVGGGLLPFWVADESFVAIRSEEIKRGMENVLRVHFACDKNKRKSKDVPPKSNVPDIIQKGYIDLDPRHSYRLMHYEFYLNMAKMSFIERAMFDYEVGRGVPVLTKKTVDSFDVPSEKRGPFNGKEVSTYTIEYNPVIPDNEFRLSHYGLPEPAGVTWPSQTRWYLWFIVCGVICLFVAGYIWRRGQRPKIVAQTIASSPRSPG